MKTWRRLAVGAVAVATAALGPASIAGASSAPTAVPQAGGGGVNGFATGDFLFLDALSTKTQNLAQVSISQSGSAVSSGNLTTSDSLGQLLWDGTNGNLNGKNAYGHAAGVSANLGQGDKSIPQIQATIAEAASPPPSHKDTNIVQIPAAPLLTATVQPDHAEANTTSADNVCVLGKPISTGTADVADAQVLPSDQVQPGFALIDATGEVLDSSTEQLAPNGAGGLGLSSSSSLNTAQVTLFKGIDGAETTIKVLNPVTLNAFAGGLPGTGKVTFGDETGKTPVISISNGGQTQKLTLDQLIGKGVQIDFDGLLKVHIGLDPTEKIASDGTSTSALADLVSVQVIGDPSQTQGSVGGPLGQVLNPVLQPVLDALAQSGVLDQIDAAMQQAGLTKGVDLRIGHFEATSQVPEGGIDCGLPVQKTVDKDPVQAGDSFTYTIKVDNPYDCTLTDVKVTDTITGSEGVLWTVTGTDPKADSQTNDKIVWNDIGPIKPGDSSEVHIDVTIPSNSAAGKFTDHATATGQCGTGSASGGTGITNATLTGEDTLNGPGVTSGGGQNPPGGTLPNTGLSVYVGFAAGLLLLAGLGALAIRRRTIG